MIGKNLMEERNLTLSEVRSILDKRKKAGELSYEQKLTLEYAKDFGRMSVTNTRKAVEEIKNILDVDEATAVMIVNVMPQDKEDLRIVFEKKRYELKDSDVKKVLDVIAKYAPVK